MNKELHFKHEISGRRSFMKQMSAYAASFALGSFSITGCATNMKKISTLKRRTSVRSGNSNVAFVPGTDQREATYQALNPFESEIIKAIGDKQVVIKVNMGQIKKEWRLNATDVNAVRGILDFLKPIYNKRVILAESTAAGAQSTLLGFENYNYMPLRKEYKVKFIDLNEQPATTRWVLGENHHPLGINIINTFLDPNIYLISATRLKTHDNIFATLSLKNVVMASPINHFKQKRREGRNEKGKMHSGGNRGLSYNMYLLATLGVQPDLAVLDGVVGMEGSGPVSGPPIEHGVTLASMDWLAADRLGVELMGIDYRWVKYLQWCSKAGMGQDDLSKIKIIGPDYTKHIVKYKLHENIETQREWIREDFKEDI